MHKSQFLYTVTNICCFLFFFFLIVPILMCMWRVIMVLIYIFLVLSNVEHLFTVLFAIYISSLEKSLFKSFVHFQIGLFGFFVVEYVSFEY